MGEFHHIGLFVETLEKGRQHLLNLIDVTPMGDEIIDENLQVHIAFMKDKQGILYELVAPYGDKSPVHGVLNRGRDILNHIAYRTPYFDDEIKRLRSHGCVPLAPPKQAKAFDGARVIFFMTPLGFIYELIEDLMDAP